MTSHDHPKLVFEYPFDERTAQETVDRGYCGHAHVRLTDGSVHPIVFYDAVRLAQDLEEEASQGRPFLAEHGMIVLTRVTIENMEAAVERLALEGFFK